MGRSQIFEYLYGTIAADTSLLAVLGAQTATNRRVYRAYPQLQSFLVGPPVYEPAHAEGWLVIEESGEGTTTARTQYETHFEVLDLSMMVFATTYGVADDAMDYLDSHLHWTLPQQRDVQFGEWYLFMTRAFDTKEDYAKEIKLVQKTRKYRLELVEAEQGA